MKKNSAVNLNIQGKSNEIDLKSLLGQNLNFDKTKFNITINKFFLIQISISLILFKKILI